MTENLVDPGPDKTIADLMPTLKSVKVAASKLILDPNNPRFLTHDNDHTDESDFLDPGVSVETNRKMTNEDGSDYRIDGLKKSIRENGWVPVDRIFVRKYLDTDRYVVLEGNRRVTAIRQLLDEADLHEDTRRSIDPLEVVEVVDDCGPEVLKTRISYLLGVRHHGSLKPWSPFAQAHNMYKRYLVISGQTDQTYQWDETRGEQVANALSLEIKRVKQRLQVYRVMQQIDQVEEVQAVDGIKARYYSICEEVLLKGGKSKLPEYIRQDGSTMLIDDESMGRMINLCHFDVSNREGAPIRNPTEWRKLDKILSDDDGSKVTAMLAEVEENKRHPSDVWAEREEERYKPRWDTWLREVSLLLGSVQFGHDLDSAEAKNAGKRLDNLLQALDDQSTEGE